MPGTGLGCRLSSAADLAAAWAWLRCVLSRCTSASRRRTLSLALEASFSATSVPLLLTLAVSIHSWICCSLVLHAGWKLLPHCRPRDRSSRASNGELQGGNNWSPPAGLFQL